MSRLKNLSKPEAPAKSQPLMETLESKKMLLNIFRGLANSPAALDAYLKFSGALREGKLDAKTREALALAIGQANGCQYCLSAHTLLGKGAGLDDAAIKSARLGQSANPKLQGALQLARQLVQTHGKVSDGDVTAARTAGLDDGDIAEVVANVALNVFTNYFNNLNHTEVDFPKVPLEVG